MTNMIEECGGLFEALAFMGFVGVGFCLVWIAIFGPPWLPNNKYGWHHQGEATGKNKYRLRLAQVHRAIGRCRTNEGLSVRAFELQGALRSIELEVSKVPVILDINFESVVSALNVIEAEAVSEQALIGDETEVALKVHLDMAGCELESSENTARGVIEHVR